MAQVPSWQDGATGRRVSDFGARESDRTPIFLSHPKAVTQEQETFLGHLCHRLCSRNLHPRTLGVTDYDIREPLAGVYGVLAQCYGFFTVAFARTEVSSGRIMRQWDAKQNETKVEVLENVKLTSPWAHIETGMAYALGLPIIIMREAGVYGDGVLEPGVAGIYLGEFDLMPGRSPYLEEAKSKQYIDAWAHQVHDVVRARTVPPRFHR